MTDIELKVWNELCNLCGEQVLQLITGFYGTQLLSDEFYDFIMKEFEK